MSAVADRVDDPSLPSRERGLKCPLGVTPVGGRVAPFTGAWIEISILLRS